MLEPEQKDGVAKQMDAQTFGLALGRAVWLMTMSKAHRDLPIKEIEDRLITPIFLQQFKIYSKGKQPVAFLSWAMVSDEVKVRVEAGERKLELKEWRSGKEVVVVECVSPFSPAKQILETFEAQSTQLTGGSSLSSAIGGIHEEAE